MRAIRHCVIALCLACQAGAYVWQPVFAEEAGRQPRGYYVLDIEMVPAHLRDRCILVGISALGGPPARNARLIARSTDGSELLAGHSRVAHYPIKEVPARSDRTWHEQVCFNDVQMFLRISADGMPMVMEVAIFPGDVAAPAHRDWSRLDYDSLRLSDWTAVPVPGWRLLQKGRSARTQ